MRVQCGGTTPTFPRLLSREWKSFQISAAARLAASAIQVQVSGSAQVLSCAERERLLGSRGFSTAREDLSRANMYAEVCSMEKFAGDASPDNCSVGGNENVIISSLPPSAPLN